MSLSRKPYTLEKPTTQFLKIFLTSSFVSISLSPTRIQFTNVDIHQNTSSLKLLIVPNMY